METSTNVRERSLDNGLAARSSENAQTAVSQPQPQPELRREVIATSTGSALGGISGAAAATLAIIGLAGTLPFYMTTIATIALGAGLFSEGTALGATSTMAEREGMMSETSAGEFGLEGVAGAGAIALGILALIGLAPGVLVPIAILGMGGALAFGGPARAEVRLAHLIAGGASARTQRTAMRAVQTTSSLMILVGLGAITLAILGLVGVGTPGVGVLSLVALLGLGGARLLDDLALLGRSLPAMRHQHR